MPRIKVKSSLSFFSKDLLISITFFAVLRQTKRKMNNESIGIQTMMEYKKAFERYCFKGFFSYEILLSTAAISLKSWISLSCLLQ